MLLLDFQRDCLISTFRGIRPEEGRGKNSNPQKEDSDRWEGGEKWKGVAD